MPDCAALFDKYFFLAKLEEEAIAAEDIERINDLASERAVLLKEAWEKRADMDEDSLRQYLLKAGACQEKLTDAAGALQSKYREQQKNGRKQSRYFNLDRNIQAELQKSFYCDKVS